VLTSGVGLDDNIIVLMCGRKFRGVDQKNQPDTNSARFVGFYGVWIARGPNTARSDPELRQWVAHEICVTALDDQSLREHLKHLPANQPTAFDAVGSNLFPGCWRWRALGDLHGQGLRLCAPRWLAREVGGGSERSPRLERRVGDWMRGASEKQGEADARWGRA